MFDAHYENFDYQAENGSEANGKMVNGKTKGKINRKNKTRSQADKKMENNTHTGTEGVENCYVATFRHKKQVPFAFRSLRGFLSHYETPKIGF